MTEFLGIEWLTQEVIHTYSESLPLEFVSSVCTQTHYDAALLRAIVFVVTIRTLFEFLFYLLLLDRELRRFLDFRPRLLLLLLV